MGRTVASGVVSLTLGHLEQAVWVVEPWPWLLCCVLAKSANIFTKPCVLVVNNCLAKWRMGA